MHYREPKKELYMSVTEQLKHILANTFVLYMKSFHVHWNMEDKRFYFLHRMLEEEYLQLAEFIDTIAERIRQKDSFAPSSLKEILKLSKLTETETVESADHMLHDLKATYEKALPFVHALTESAGKDSDYATQDIMIEFSRFIEKTLWILKSHMI